MRAFLFLLFMLIAGPALAESYIGTITLTSAASKHNRDTATAFTITNPKVTIQCTVAMWVCTDRDTCSATTGYQVAAEPAGLPTDLVSMINISGVQTYVVSIFPVSGSTGACRVYTRTGKEMTWYRFPAWEEYYS